MSVFFFVFNCNPQPDAPQQTENDDTGASPYVTATAVTTRRATTTEDLGTNAKTSQVCFVNFLLIKLK